MVAAIVLYASCSSGESKEAPSGTASPTVSPPRTPTPTPTFPHSEVTHKVQEGDTLYDIAQLYGVTVEAIVAANHLEDPTSISIGQILIIPDPSYTPAPATAPVPAAPPQRTPSSPLVEVSSRRRPSSPGRPSSRERPSARPLAPPVRGRRDERVPETPAEPPSIRVTIGRVEVRAVSPPPPAEPPPPAKPRISLDDYLRSHRGRSR